MTSTTNTTSSSRTKGAIALATGAVLLLGGSTFALWTAQSQVAGGTITSGNVDVLVSEGTWQDVSPEHAAPIDIADLADFTMVPGDALRGTFAVDVAGLGDNFLAELAVGFAGASGELLADLHGVSLTYAIADSEGNLVGSGSTVDVISADSSVTAPGAIVVDNVATGANPELTATITATFDEATPEQIRVATEALLGDLTATLSQKRA